MSVGGGWVSQKVYRSMSGKKKSLLTVFRGTKMTLNEIEQNFRFLDWVTAVYLARM